MTRPLECPGMFLQQLHWDWKNCRLRPDEIDTYFEMEKAAWLDGLRNR